MQGEGCLFVADVCFGTEARQLVETFRVRRNSSTELKPRGAQGARWVSGVPSQICAPPTPSPTPAGLRRNRVPGPDGRGRWRFRDGGLALALPLLLRGRGVG